MLSFEKVKKTVLNLREKMPVRSRVVRADFLVGGHLASSCFAHNADQLEENVSTTSLMVFLSGDGSSHITKYRMVEKRFGGHQRITELGDDDAGYERAARYFATLGRANAGVDLSLN